MCVQVPSCVCIAFFYSYNFTINLIIKRHHFWISIQKLSMNQKQIKKKTKDFFTTNNNNQFFFFRRRNSVNIIIHRPQGIVFTAYFPFFFVIFSEIFCYVVLLWCIHQLFIYRKNLKYKRRLTSLAKTDELLLNRVSNDVIGFSTNLSVCIGSAFL